MRFTIEHPNGTTTTEERDVSYYQEGTVYSIKRKRNLGRIAERLVPDTWMTYNVVVAGDIQREGDMPYGVEAEPFIIRDEVGRGNAKVYAAPMRKDELARAARFRTAFTDEYNQLCKWYRDRLEESAAAWGGADELEEIAFEEYFEPYLSDGFLFNSANSHEVTGGQGPSNVIVRANKKAREAFRQERDALLSEQSA